MPDDKIHANCHMVLSGFDGADECLITGVDLPEKSLDVKGAKHYDSNGKPLKKTYGGTQKDVGTVTIRGFITSSKAILDWAKKAEEAGSSGDDAESKKTLIVEIKTADDETLRTYNLIGAVPKSIGGLSLLAESSEPIVESLTCELEDYTIE